MRVRWTERALKDIDGIYQYIAQDSIQHAQKTIAGIKLVAHAAAKNVMSGRVVPEYNNPKIRERFYRRYRVIYRMLVREIEIIAVSHGSRLFG